MVPLPLSLAHDPIIQRCEQVMELASKIDGEFHENLRWWRKLEENFRRAHPRSKEGTRGAEPVLYPEL